MIAEMKNDVLKRKLGRKKSKLTTKQKRREQKQDLESSSASEEKQMTEQMDILFEEKLNSKESVSFTVQAAIAQSARAASQTVTITQGLVLLCSESAGYSKG